MSLKNNTAKQTKVKSKLPRGGETDIWHYSLQ